MFGKIGKDVGQNREGCWARSNAAFSEFILHSMWRVNHHSPKTRRQANPPQCSPGILNVTNAFRNLGASPARPDIPPEGGEHTAPAWLGAFFIDHDVAPKDTQKTSERHPKDASLNPCYRYAVKRL
jgi:hypothetical protein